MPTSSSSRSTRLALYLLAVAVSTPAMAASHDLSTFIKEQDLDKDGKVSKDEYAKARATEFARTDTDHNGTLSQDEYVGDYRTRLEKQLLTVPTDEQASLRERQMKQAYVRFNVLDSDKSGSITPAEYDASGWAMFLRHDSNHDGFVSADDAATAEK